MPTPGVALRLERLRRRFGIAAPRVAVRSHLGWLWYLVGATGVAVVIAALVWVLSHQGGAATLEREIRELRRQVDEREAELARLRAGATVEENAVQIERTARQQLISHIKALEHENAELKEDVSLLERLVRECPRKTGLGKHN